MSGDQAHNYDSFYVIRITDPIPRHLIKTAENTGVYLTAKRRLGSLRKALTFSQLEHAEQVLANWPGRSRYQTQIQFCTREHAPESTDATRALVDRLMQIPHPYRRTAYNWARGLDVRSLLLRESPETFDRHRRFLLDYDIDITRSASVVLLRPRRKKIRLDNVPPVTENDPRQYFVPSKARPGGGKATKYKK
jgi:hypothetical protein